MKIGIDGSFLEDESLYSGMGVYTLELVRGLASFSTQDQITLLGYGARPKVLPDQIRWERLSRPLDGRYAVWFQHQWLIRRAIRKLDLDLYHVPGLNMRLSRPGIPLFSPRPMVVTVHDAIPHVHYQGKLSPRLRLGYWLGIQAARRAESIITVSETSRRDLLRMTSLRPTQLKAIHNGVPRMETPPEQDRQEILSRLGIVSPYLLYAGSYEPRKNLISAVAAYRDAMDHVSFPALVLLLEKESGYKRRSLEEIEQLKIGDRLKIVHSLSGNELGTVFHDASLLLYPSLYEGFGLPPLQAMMLGVPVIASNRGSLPEILGGAAQYADPESVEEIAAAIQKVLNDQEHAKRLSAAGRLQAQKYNWETTARATLDVYRSATADTAGAAEERDRIGA